MKEEPYEVHREEKKNKTSLVLYEEGKVPQTLIEDIRGYDVIKVDNRVYYGDLKYSRMKGYYYNERFDVLIELTQDKEMIVYSEKEEKGRTRFEIKRPDKYVAKEMELSPLGGEDFTLDIFKDIYWNDEVFLTHGSVFKIEDWRGYTVLKLADKELILAKISKEEFKEHIDSQKDGRQEKEKELVTDKEALLFTRWYIEYFNNTSPSKLEVINEDEKHYIVQAYFGSDDKSYKNQYHVDKQHGTATPLQENEDEKITAHKDVMTYSIDNDMLWMIDEKGEKGRLFKVKVLKDVKQKEGKIETKFLWQKDHNIYFIVKRYDELEEYIEADLYRYDLIKRKVVYLTGGYGAFSDVDFEFEEERGTICICSVTAKHEVTILRLDAVLGEYLEAISPGPQVEDKESTKEDNVYEYEIIRPKGKSDFYICQYNKQTRKNRLLCKINTFSYYDAIMPGPVVKLSDEIYFMDYTYYVTEEDRENHVGKAGKPFVFCKVNIKTGVVNRVTKDEYIRFLDEEDKLRIND